MTDRIRVVHPEGGPLMTKQAMALDTDINAIVSRWIAHGQVPRASNAPARYGDFSSGLEFHGAMNQVREAEQHFMELPAHIRRHCRNDPGEFLDLVMNPERRAELVELGLVEGQVPPKASEVPEPVEPAAPAAGPVTP